MLSAEERDGLLAVTAAASEMARGVTDSAALSWQDARHRIEELDPVAVRTAATAWLLDQARSDVRSTNLEVEIAASRQRERAEAVAAESQRRSSLYRGKYRHGSLNGREGAAVRGCECDECVAARNRDAEYERGLLDVIKSAVSTFESRLRMQWTSELLASSFALGDGSTVTWANATAADHEARIAMLAGNARANIEAAARHQAALRTIHEAGAATLADALRSAAA